MKLRSVQITGDGEDALLILGVDNELEGAQVSYRFPGRVHVTMTSDDSGYLRLNVTVRPVTRKRELAEKNVPQQRFDV